MKKILVIASMLVGVSAFAQTTTQSTSCPNGATTCAGATSASGSSASNQGQGNGNNLTAPVTVTITQPAAEQRELTRSIVETTGRQEIVQSGTTTLKNVPSVNGPPLVSSNDTCMGSASGAVNGPGFGVALGKTYKDDNCIMLKNSRELWNMGMKAAALALMCKDPDNREALELTGFVCPQTAKAQAEQKKAAAAQTQEYTDPIVRARLGLPPLEAAK